MTDIQRIAFKQAAVATLQHGFDQFVIVSTDSGSRLTSYYQPAITTYGSTSTFIGGTTFFGNTPHRELTIMMFHDGDPDADEALDARTVLGPDWADIVNEGEPDTC